MFLKSMRYAFYAAPVVLTILGCQSPGLTVSALDSARNRRVPDAQNSASATLEAASHVLDGSNVKSRIPVASPPIIIRTSDETIGDRPAKVNTASPSNDPADPEGGTRTVPGPLPSITKNAEPLKTNSSADQETVGDPLGGAFIDDLLLDSFPDQSEADADAGKFRSKSRKQAADTKTPPSKDTVEEKAATEEKSATAATPPVAIDTTEEEAVSPSLIWAEDQKPAATAAGRLAKRETGKKIVEAIARKLHGAELNDYDLTIEFRNGVATLKGQVTYPEQKLAATHLTALVPGVQRVDNQLSPVRESITKEPAGTTIEIDPLPTDGEDSTTPNKKSAFDLTNLLPDGAGNEPGASATADSPQPASDAANDSAKTAADEKRPLNDFPSLAEDVDPSRSPSIAAKPDKADSAEATTGVDTDSNAPSAETVNDLPNPFPDLSEEEADGTAKRGVAKLKAEKPANQATAADEDANRVLPTAAVENELLGLFPDMSEQEADRRSGLSKRWKPKPRPQPRVQINPPAQPKRQPQRIRPPQQESQPQTPPPADDLLDAFPDGSEEEADRLKGVR